MKFDFRGVEDVQSYVYVPPGAYVCRVAEVRPGMARDGSVRWSLRMEVAEGDQLGRTAAWDSLTWSDRGVARVKLVLKALGMPTHGVVEIEPQDLVGRRARVTVQPEERENAQTGLREVRNRVPYAGFEAVDSGAADDRCGADAPCAPTAGQMTRDELLDEVPFGAVHAARGRTRVGVDDGWGGSKEDMTMTRSTSAGGLLEMDDDESYAATQVSELGCSAELTGVACGAVQDEAHDDMRRSADEGVDGSGCGRSGGGGSFRGGSGGGLDDNGSPSGGGPSRRLSGASGADAALRAGIEATGLAKQAASASVHGCQTGAPAAATEQPAPKKRGRPRKHPLPDGTSAPTPAKAPPAPNPKPKGRGL